MAGIKQPIIDLLKLLETVTVINGDGYNATPYVRIWNNQITRIKERQLEAFALPAMFVELANPTFENIGEGLRSSALTFKIHIAHEFYDAQDGTFDQDLVVFDIRDKVIATLSGHALTGCGPLDPVGESLDTDHDNVYHYVIDFTCDFTDSTGSRNNAISPLAYIDSPTPIDLIQNIFINE